MPVRFSSQIFPRRFSRVQNLNCDQQRLQEQSSQQSSNGTESTNGAMGFFLISLYFVLSGLVGTLGIKLCYNKGPSTNMLNVVLVNTAVICCWLMWAIVWLAQWKPLINPVLKGEGE